MKMPTGCACIVEPRKHPSLGLSIRSVYLSIPKQWPIFVFHGSDNVGEAEKACEHVPSAQLHSLGVTNLTIHDYNHLLTDPSFYNHFADYDYVLIFQTDSLMFPFAPKPITEFLGTDWIGACWRHHPKHKGGNGGFSLRNVKRMQELLTKHPYPPKCQIPEDLYICNLPGIRLPERSVSMQFSVESIFYPTPLAVHKPWLFLDPQQWRKLLQYAPIVKELRRLNRQK